MKAYASLLLFVAAVIAVFQPAILRAEETEAVKVVWQRNLYDAFQQALAEQKPLVVLFTSAPEDDCGWCQKFDAELIDSKEMRTLSGRAIFVRALWTDEDTHGNYAQLKSDLNIKRVPTTTVLDVTKERSSETGRIVGFHKRDKFIGYLNEFFKELTDTRATAETK